MILSVWSWLAGLFRAVLRYVFSCISCGTECEVVAESAEEAKAELMRLGWRGQPRPGAPKGWRCPACAGN